MIASGFSQALFVHVIASLKNAKRIYLAIASFPVIEDALLQRKVKRLTLNMGIISLDCLTVNQNRQNTKTRRGAVVNMRSLLIATFAGPQKHASVSFQGPQYCSSRNSAC
jgi:hypothetical protein